MAASRPLWEQVDFGFIVGSTPAPSSAGARPKPVEVQMAELPPPPEGIVLAHFIVSDDVERSRRFCTEVLGGRLAFLET